MNIESKDLKYVLVQSRAPAGDCTIRDHFKMDCGSCILQESSFKKYVPEANNKMLGLNPWTICCMERARYIIKGILQNEIDI